MSSLPFGDPNPPLAADCGRLIRAARLAIGWTQRELGLRAGVSQAAISRLERGERSGLGLEEVDRIVTALGCTIRLSFEAPYLSDRARQRDRVHARCIAHVASHLRRLGWLVETEVEIDGRRGPGWIDVLAFHVDSRTLLVIEIKTEIHDFGRIQRALAWYERRAWSVARDHGWDVRRSHGARCCFSPRMSSRRASVTTGRSRPRRFPAELPP